ncbi:MAG: tannase/feruloyl esterase family alpha/beta hydrolase [Bryobacteraceae bacterium]|nr:tannase/feruloyl esterase family alpha/beta hydrolase [Bryobacteraceae bacterium]
MPQNSIESITRRFVWTFLAGVAWAQSPCDRVGQLKLDQLTITSAQVVPAAKIPAHCAVKATARPTADSEIRFEVWLPLEGWNGKYQQVGNGGWAGSIPTGLIAAAVARGYAAAGTDNGHESKIPGALWAIGHPEKLIDFGYRSLKVTSTHAKAMIRAFYEKPASRSYFVGCSDGGREALMQAQRYPEDFDGIIAGAPANDWSYLLTAAVWNAQALLKDPKSAIPPSKLPAIQKAVVAACDKLDGVTDGLLEDPRQCKFDPAVLTCAAEDTADCLTAPQVTALRKIYQGPRNPRTGRQIYPGNVPGTEAVPGGWSTWTITNPPQRALLYGFGTSYYGHAVFEDPKWDINSLEFDTDVEYGFQKAGVHLNSGSPDLRTFRAHGGKLIQFHGWGDAAISAFSSIDYYERVNTFMKRYPDPRATGAPDLQNFYRLFMVPGMGHCAGGIGPNSFGQGSPVAGPAENDVLTALEQWVELGKAPNQLVGKGVTGGATPVPLTRPLCVYPQVARYNGSGDANVASSFSCVVP